MTKTQSKNHPLRVLQYGNRGGQPALKPAARAVAWALLAGATPVWAGPTGEQVVAGQATVSRSATGTLINQTTDRAAIHWQSFNIGAGESVRFVQPSASSVALNRVIGQNPTEILGALSSNGQIFLLNPNGVFFGRGAQVSVGGLVASTLGLSTDDFMAGRYRFIKEGAAGDVRNAGDIIANGGYVAMLGPRVKNEGTITAASGSVALAAGDHVTLNLNGNKLIGLKVDQGSLNALADNKGLMRADGGQVLLTARAADQLIKSVVNNDGIIQAGSIQRVNGVLRLEGDVITQGGTLRADGDATQGGGSITLAARHDITLGASSVLSASGARGGDITVQAAVGQPGGTLLADGRIDATGSAGSGGTVKLLGERVGLINAVTVDASGQSGGGTVLVGGDFQGKNPEVRNALRTVVSAGAAIKADATLQGDGGKVIVWADDATRFQGSISAQGGTQSGNGGLVEVSGKTTLDFAGTVNTRAANGNFGTLLLDPTNITVVAGATPNPPAAADGLWAFGEDAGNQNIGATAINTLLTANNLTLQATNNITVSAAISYTGAADRTLTLQANNNVTVSSAIATTAGRLNMVFNADADNNGVGAAAVNNNLTTRGGSITATGFNVTSNAGGTVSTAGAAGLNLDGGSVTLTAANTGAVNFTKAINTSGGTAAAANSGRNAGAVNISGGTVQVGAITATGSPGVAAGVRTGGAGGNVTLDATGAAPTVTMLGAITARGGNGVGGGTGGNGGTVLIADPALVNNTVAINTTQGTGGAPTGGNITFASTLNSATATARAVSAAAGTGNIVFGGAVGDTQQLQTLSANGRTVSASAVRTNGSQSYTGPGGITLTGGTLQAVTGTAAAQAIAFSGPVTLSGATVIQTPGGAADNITFSTTSTINGAQNLTLNAGAAGNVTLGAAVGSTTALNGLAVTGAVVSARAVTTTGSQSYTGTGVTLNGNLTSSGTAAADTIAVTGPVTLAGTTIVQTSGAAADGIAFSSTLNGARALTLNANLGSVTLGGTVGQTTALTSFSATAGSLTLPAVRAGTITERSTSGNITLNGVQTATGAGNSVVIAAATDFVNNVGAGAIVSGAGRWLVYSTSPAGSTENGLTAVAGSAQPRLYNRTFGANPPASIAAGNHLIYSAQPAVTVTADNRTRVYGDANPAFTFTTSGLVVDDGFTDTLVTAGITGAPVLSTTAVANSPVTGSPYAINSAVGTLASTAGYGFALASGQLTVTPRPVTVTTNPGQNKVYGNIDPVLTFSASSLGGGDPLSGALARAAGENAGNYAINAGTITNAGNPNYNITFVGNTFNISQRPITVSAVSDTRIYDGTLASLLSPVVTAGSLAGVDSGAFTQTFDNRNVGSGKTLTAAGVVNDGNGGNNYAVTFVANTAGTITAAPITVSAQTDNRVYNGGTNSSIAPLVSGTLYDAIGTAAVQSFDNKNAGSGKTLTASGLLINDGNGGTNYSVTYVTNNTGVITPAAIANVTGITANNKVYDANATATLNTAAAGFTGLIGTDVLTVAAATGAFTDKNAATGKTVNISGITLGGADAGNYTLTTNTATTIANITPVTIANVSGITANNKVYDASPTATLNTAAAGFTGLIGTDVLTVATATGTFTDKNAATGKTVNISGITLGGTDAGNYTLTTNTATTIANITPVTIANVSGITANNKVYDAGTAATLNTGTAGFTGILGTDVLTVAAATGAFTDKNAATGKTVNISGITLGGADAGNYTLTTNTATATANITPAAITNVTGITANNKVYDAGTAATLNTGAAGFTGILGTDVLTVATATGAFTDKNAATGKTVNISGITLGGADANNYTLISNTAATPANITPAPLNVIYTGVGKVYDGTVSANVTTTDNRFAGDTLTVNRTANFSDRNAGVGKTVSVTGVSLAGIDAGNYNVSPSGSATADITARGITLTANDASKVYGNADPALTFSVGGGGLVGGDTITSVITGALARVPGENVAGSPYAINLGTLAPDSNYSVTAYTPGQFSITPRPLAIAADNKQTTVGAPLPPFTASYTGFAFADNPGSLSGTLSFATAATAVSPTGIYTITPSGQTSSNYAISYVSGQLAVGVGASLIPNDVAAAIRAGAAQLPPPFVSGPVVLPTSFAAVRLANVTGDAPIQVAQGSEADALVAPGAGGQRPQDDERGPLVSGAVKTLVRIINGGMKLPDERGTLGSSVNQR